MYKNNQTTATEDLGSFNLRNGILMKFLLLIFLNTEKEITSLHKQKIYIFRKAFVCLGK